MKRSKNGIREPDRGSRTRRDVDRNGNNSGSRNTRRSRSRSPIKSKLMALAMSSTATKSKSGGNEKSRRDRETSRDREMNLRRMRMDELDEKRSKQRVRSPVVDHRRVPTGPKNKSASTLDKVVKKAREQRSNYWDKKILEVEEKDPQRWGHSGFKELYQKDFKRPPGSPKRLRRSRSSSSPRPYRSPPSPRFNKSRHSHSRSRSLQRRSKSRSRSPINRSIKSRKDIHRSFTRSRSPEFTSAKSRGLSGRVIGVRPKGDMKQKVRSQGDSIKSKGQIRSINQTPSKLIGKSKPASRGHIEKPLVKSTGRRIAKRSSSFTSSGSSSRSRSRSFSPSPVKRTSVGMKSLKTKALKTNKRAASVSMSSSSSSSDDEDVLQLHARIARGKGRSPSLSYSDSRSSSSPSVKKNQRNLHSSSSSSSSASVSSSDSDSDESIRNKPRNSSTLPITPKEKVVANKPIKVVHQSQKQNVSGKPPLKKPIPSNGSDLVNSASKVVKPAVKKSQTLPLKKNTVVEDSNKTAAKVIKPPTVKAPITTEKEKSPILTTSTKKPVPKAKSASESGETESETDSSSDSDSEPRMTLSERFAKLAQMSTDKREMAKPVLSVNEIDTKMRVIKDFRNPETPKVYVTGQGAASANEKSKMRPKSPPQYPHHEGEKRFASEERRRHFERMYRDEPAERPLDWSDVRVRYNYYKERGCFDERPINLDEYVKWEDWYNKYREWLEHEGYYDRMGGGGGSEVRRAPAPAPVSNNWQYGQQGERMRQNYPPGRRVEHVDGPPLSSRPNFGRPESNAYLHSSIGRRIDRTPGGSLVVNIRQGGNAHNYEPRGGGRRIGMGRPR